MSAPDPPGYRALGLLGAVWGLSGVVLLLASAVYRLAHWALDAFAYPLSPAQWALLVGFALFMLIGEGYRGFQKNFSPRVATRARHLSSHPTPLRVALAPLFLMGFFGATRRRKITTWCLTIGIVVLVVGVRHLDQPWRGIIDLGVVLGLAWGLIALLAFTCRAFSRDGLAFPTDLEPSDSPRRAGGRV
jgi:hypothetical protein